MSGSQPFCVYFLSPLKNSDPSLIGGGVEKPPFLEKRICMITDSHLCSFSIMANFKAIKMFGVVGRKYDRCHFSYKSDHSSSC